MHIKSYRSTRYLYFLRVLCILLVSHNKTATGQSKTRVQEFESVARANSLELVDILDLDEDAAWSEKNGISFYTLSPALTASFEANDTVADQQILHNDFSMHKIEPAIATSKVSSRNQREKMAEYRVKLHALVGDFYGAYKLSAEALAHERDVEAALMMEVEHHEIARQKTEEIKKQQTSWLLVISCAASILVPAIYITMLNRSRKVEAQMQALCNVSNIQNLTIEEIKYQAVRDEQNRLGQDLHDVLFSSIVGIKHQLETLSMDTVDISLRNKLAVLQMEVTNAYEVVRDKSHEWFNATDDKQEQSFEKRIKVLTDNVMPNNSYGIAIQIDNRSLIRVSTVTRIALLHIIQEAITNIIKHAGAKNVGILIYEEMDSLILVINDDGKGMGKKGPAKSKATMGLQSIQHRVQSLKGETKICSDPKGTEITVSVPLTLS